MFTKIVLLKNFDSYYYGYNEKGKHYDGYVELIYLYGAILTMKNVFFTFDNFEGKEILSNRDFQDYWSEYIDFYQNINEEMLRKKRISILMLFS